MSSEFERVKRELDEAIALAKLGQQMEVNPMNAMMQFVLENVDAVLPDIIRFSVAQARIRRAVYEASIEQGFTPEQAFELCQKGPI